jgi:hypothetical protein
MRYTQSCYPKQTLNIEHDRRIPIKCSRNHVARKAVEENNELLLAERASHGRRTVVVCEFMVYSRRGARSLRYNKLAGQHVLMSCPTPSQAKAAVKLIQRVAESLDGKWLVEEE